MPHTKPRARTEAETVAEWIENYARVPVGPNRGQRVQLSPAQREMLFKICDNPTGDLNAAAALLDPELSAYLPWFIWSEFERSGIATSRSTFAPMSGWSGRRRIARAFAVLVISK